MISRIERGQRELTLLEVSRICEVLDDGLLDLLAGADTDDIAPLRLR